MNKLQLLYRSAANWRVPLPWWVSYATFGFVFWGSGFIVISLVVLTGYKHTEHIDPWLIIGSFVGLFLACRDAIAFRNLPRYWDCSEPPNWETMTPDPFNDITSTSKSSTGIVFSTYRDGKGNEYVRYVDPDGSVSWKRWKWKRQKKVEQGATR